MNYLEHYGLRSEPFSNAPVDRFYFDAEQHQQALVRLLHVVENMKGLAVLLGEVGAGKTTLARRLLASLPEAQYEAALLVIIHRDVTSDWLLRRLAVQLGVTDPSPEKLTLLSQVYRRLVEIHEQGKKAIVLIDEAQMLASRDLMEEFRGLLNLEVPERKLLTFVFFGLPELETNLQLDPPLAQRVALRVQLGPLDARATAAYVRHRLFTAGATHELIEDDALRLIHAAAGGYPRLINTLCDNLLLEGALANRRALGSELTRIVIRSLGLEHAPAPQSEPAPPAPAQHPVPIVTGEPIWPPEEPLDDATVAALEEIDRVLASLGKG